MTAERGLVTLSLSKGDWELSWFDMLTMTAERGLVTLSLSKGDWELSWFDKLTMTVDSRQTAVGSRQDDRRQRTTVQTKSKRETMQILSIKGNNDVYTSNVYLLLGDWKRIEDVNTLIDVGSDPSIIETLETTATGIGKNKIDQVILTHGHSDHTAALPWIIEAYRPKVMAFSHYLDGVDRVLKNGDVIRAGDALLEVIHTPCHTEDSICLYNPDTGALFVGDTPVIVQTTDANYERRFYEALKSICNRKVRSIYFGHGEPLRHHVRERLYESLRNVRECLRD